MRLNCPHCNVEYNVDESRAGQVIQCAACCEEFLIPMPPPPPPPATIVESRPAPKESEPAIDPKSKTCPMCGETILAVAKKCRYCGSMLDGDQAYTEIDRLTFIVLGFLFGGLGAHNFYARKPGAACFNIVLSLLTWPTFGVTGVANFFIILFEICSDPNNEKVRKKWKKNDNFYWWTSIVVFLAFMAYVLYRAY